MIINQGIVILKPSSISIIINNVNGEEWRDYTNFWQISEKMTKIKSLDWC